ncbi:hypothetical protein HETIRDRAFT_474957 [Heterobasidion irregulare TC 32-1]|uniref:Arrestin-like N-terminal domain-containing protein n=1 Tax=Heterobasidion irregulare (strain TC 32-1) TaxID=747525 RepID=W4K9D8_HETIT|nr:uncharacterized protein HETIRDRAFT_474957 [Heterobasidion irregulare TC 32-1]ETW82344.1 hypothetical protein HETIRDRAFT_474957 [Heterobasidion irregulare TC 32-1]
MSTASLPGYTPPDFSSIPSYTAEPQGHERRLAQAPRPPYRQRAAADFVKHSKSGGLSLRLSEQMDGAVVPVYGARSPIEGVVELAKADGLAYVAVKVEGILKLKEVAAGGTTTAVLCNETVHLWRKGVDGGPCPCRLAFSVTLPSSFADEKGTYPLPPTYEAHLSGLPGFQAHVDYSVTAIASKSKTVVLGLGATTVCTPFTYHPRFRPSTPLPPPMALTHRSPGLQETPQWRIHESKLVSRSQGAGDITCKLYLPKSSVFCLSEPIPFHLSFVASAMSLAALLPFVPSANPYASGRPSTRIQLLRQTSVDVKNDYVPEGTNTEIWRVLNIGEGSFWRTADGPDWISFAGEIAIKPDVKIGGFKAGGLWVKDCVVLSITPPDAIKGPIGDLRHVVPVRIVTDPWSTDGAVSRESPTGSEEFMLDQPALEYHAQ